MRRNYFGRGMLAAALVAAGGANYGCAPTVTMDPWTGEQRVENQLDSDETALTLAETVFDGPVSRILIRGARNAQQKQKLQEQVDRANAAEAENRRLKALIASGGDRTKLRDTLSDRDLVATLEDNPCFFLDYLGRDNRDQNYVSTGAHSLESLAEVWLIESGDGIDGTKSKSSKVNKRSSLECDGKVLRLEYNWSNSVNVVLGVIKTSESRMVRYVAWDEEGGEFKTLEQINVHVAPKVGKSYSRTTFGAAKYDEKSRRFVFNNSSNQESAQSGG